jgi:phosphoenolpyruvate carboxykinase (diphosphate)
MITNLGVEPEVMNASMMSSEIKQKKDRRQQKYHHINLQLAALGQPTCEMDDDRQYLDIANGLLKKYSQQQRLLAKYRCPADQRIEDFLNRYLLSNSINETIRIPGETFVLEQKGLARELSLPYQGDEFHSAYVDSYRIQQGVLHNPQNDKRTTKGVFHIAGGGLPVPADKNEVPVAAYAAILSIALAPPENLLSLPFTINQATPAKLWVSLLQRPIVRPALSAGIPAQTMEVRFFAPGGLVSNLDFVESIFGNAGDPFLPENDSALDIDHWTGHTGCIILAPHLVHCNKKALGLPHYDDATPRQRKDGMCWQQEDELYNDGKPFKLVCRDMQGIIVTIIADNYFGYSKKEIKSHISYAANLFGDCEEEHAGGALAFPRVILGEIHIPSASDLSPKPSFKQAHELLAPSMEYKDTGYGVDKNHPDIIFVPSDAQINIQDQQISWLQNNHQQSLKLLIKNTYIYPNGFRVHMERHPHAPSWRLVGTYPEGTFCHKPSTVSGGGKSEISKSLAGAVISGDFFVEDFDKDMDFVRKIFDHDYTNRFRDPALHGTDQRSLLSSKRTLGSVIKLLTPSVTDYSDAYNQWLEEIPQHILGLVLMIKRFYKKDWGQNWRQHFSVDLVNGKPGNELKYHGRKLRASYLRVGFDEKGAWRIFKLRQDFIASEKLQMEDDITASTVVPVRYLPGLNPDYNNPSVKLVNNCEESFFQRPDDAIHRGTDLQTELDFSGKNNFISNFQPLNTEDAKNLLNDVMHFEEFSEPMQKVIRDAALAKNGQYFVSSAHPRLVDGKPSQNVRYLQARPDLIDPKMRYVAELSTRLARGLRHDQPVYFPVNSVLTGRRNNPIDHAAGIRPLAIYNPIHYQELPELFMDMICSLTGKSPSTTGAGSEGALTKGPFNAVSTTADLNTALVSFILCGYDGFSTAAGYIGSKRRIDHDISLLIPEIWSRLPVEQRCPNYLIANGQLEKLEDFEYQGKTVYASRLGYRITERFVHTVFGKVFNYPTAVFDEAMLKPETQDMASYVDGVNNVYEAQLRVAQQYFEDGSIDDACPPLKALLHIMVHGNYEGKTLNDLAIRNLFTRDYLLQSDWYNERLKIKQQRDSQLWQRHKAHIEHCLADKDRYDPVSYATLSKKLEHVEKMLAKLSSADYLASLQGTLGADWVHR